jgi:hypothetical protein
MTSNMCKGVYMEPAESCSNGLEYIPTGTERVIGEIRSTPGTEAPNGFDQAKIVTEQLDWWEWLLVEGEKLL